jgi:3-deoxy-D-manno-octulosonate 8-phosphate phosphatase (KDO 8-P phosphatase)
MDDVTMGNYKKIDEYSRLKNKFNITDEEIAYIGDDMPDLPCIQAAGFSGCPNDAVKEIQSNVSYVCQRVGGDGAVREFIEKMIELSLI